MVFSTSCGCCVYLSCSTTTSAQLVDFVRDSKTQRWEKERMSRSLEIALVSALFHSCVCLLRNQKNWFRNCLRLSSSLSGLRSGCCMIVSIRRQVEIGYSRLRKRIGNHGGIAERFRFRRNLKYLGREFQCGKGNDAIIQLNFHLLIIPSSYHFPTSEREEWQWSERICLSAKFKIRLRVEAAAIS